MTRLLAAVLLVLVLATPARGTLVVMVPSREGLVVAADSRTSFLGTTCDSQYKIAVLRRPRRTVIAVTGDVAFIEPPGPQVRDLCGYLASAPRRIDIPSVVKHSLEARNTELSKLSFEEASAECVRAVQRFLDLNPLEGQAYAGREVFSVVIASYHPGSRSALVLNFTVRIDAITRKAAASRFARIAMTSQTRRGVWSYGETDYLNKYVFGGVGRGYLTASTLGFILLDEPIAGVRLDEAVAAAANIIEAASRTTQLIPSPSGIGGPIDIVLLGQKRHPRQIRWKGER